MTFLLLEQTHSNANLFVLCYLVSIQKKKKCHDNLNLSVNFVFLVSFWITTNVEYERNTIITKTKYS